MDDPPQPHETERTWVVDAPLRGGAHGCASHRGPPKIWQDKENEDFAFSLPVKDHRGADWVLAGVCDGVTQSPWSDRGARHVAQCFVQLVKSELAHDDLAKRLQDTEGKHEFAARFSKLVRGRLSLDGQQLQAARKIDPKFGESLFKREFLDSPKAHLREAWFQTTILATALGPHGGFVLFIGDGYLRVERKRPDGSSQSREIPLQPESGKPERFVGTALSADEVLLGIRGVAPDGASEISVVMATDGVSKSPEHGLEEFAFRDAAGCRAFLEQLASRPDDRVESDNMSVAFASRSVVL